MSGKYIYKAKRDDRDEMMSSICFQVSPNVQLKEVPTNGEEYLLKVIKEREKYAAVTKCTKDYSIYAKNQSCFVEELPRAKVPEKFKPTIEWQNIQVADFSDVRMYVSRVLANKSLWPGNIKQIHIGNNTLKCWKRFFDTREPTLSCVLGLRLPSRYFGLEYLTEMLDDVKKGDTIDHRTGQWIYAFLACMGHPLHSDTISTLRDLARKCAEIRSHINPDDSNAHDNVAPLNIFICIIARYFRQYDLAD